MTSSLVVGVTSEEGAEVWCTCVCVCVCFCMFYLRLSETDLLIIITYNEHTSISLTSDIGKMKLIFMIFSVVICFPGGCRHIVSSCRCDHEQNTVILTYVLGRHVFGPGKILNVGVFS